VKRLKAFGGFWWDFVVGEDWMAAAGILAAIAVTAAVARSHVAAWWIMPLAVAAVLYASLRRATRR
jgi:hypothetical protein